MNEVFQSTLRVMVYLRSAFSSKYKAPHITRDASGTAVEQAERGKQNPMSIWIAPFSSRVFRRATLKGLCGATVLRARSWCSLWWRPPRTQMNGW